MCNSEPVEVNSKAENITTKSRCHLRKIHEIFMNIINEMMMQTYVHFSVRYKNTQIYKRLYLFFYIQYSFLYCSSFGFYLDNFAKNVY